MFRRLVSGTPQGPAINLRREYPETSWPADLDNLADADLPAGIVRVHETARPSTPYCDIADAGFVHDGTQWVRQWDVTPWDLERTRKAVMEQISQKKWEVETGGITLPDGTPLRTGIEDQNRISNAVVNGQRLGLTSVSFKNADNEFVTIPMATLVTIADAIGLHVQACFDAEAAHHAAVKSLDREDILAYDINAGWPGEEE